jgi:hypothetical protein
LILTFTPGEVSSFFYPLIRFGLKAVDHVAVLTTAEINVYRQLFGLSDSRITVCLLGMYDIQDQALRSDSPGVMPSGPYLHTSGRSARDFDTLSQAVEGLDVKVVVHARPYNLQSIRFPENVEIGDLVPRPDYNQLVFHSQFEIVPLQDTLLPVGSSQIVFAMMMGKAVLATRTSSTVDYVEDGVTGVLVEPGDVAGMRAAVLRLLDDPKGTERMGQAARQRFEKKYTFDAFAHRAYELIKRVAAS